MAILDGWQVCNSIPDCHSPQRSANALWHSRELHNSSAGQLEPCKAALHVPQLEAQGLGTLAAVVKQ